MNPFDHHTGPILFNWQKDENVLHGKAPFEFRTVEEPIQKGHLLWAWQNFIDASAEKAIQELERSKNCVIQ